MRGRNYGVCHSCGSTYHSFEQCNSKRRCPWCVDGIQKCFEVEKEGKNKGRLFKTCSVDSGFFDWVKANEASGGSSTNNEAVDNLPSMFDDLARIADKRNVEISFNVTFRKGKEPSDGNGK